MKLKLAVFITLMNLSGIALAAPNSATNTLHWKGITPSILPSDSVIITGPNGVIPYADSAGLVIKDSSGVFSSDNIALELHYRKCQNGDSGGDCEAQQTILTDDINAVGDIINDASWTMNSVETVIGTQQTAYPFTWTEVKMNGVTMDKSTPITATSGTVIFNTENAVAMGSALAVGQNIEVHTVISSSKAI
ncbi:hypothetical protein [Psychromonas sp. Urea-02u-13]|uniref:hypothetical protein n=1 Tax=Psychromonas sp. Urea-02u-13 TaxID=2058326 RepID=UPI000C33B609|nr:hypothetical protein [Psychromonas sp. Urea-02u-13]PKG40501.1 hypothetical protein CXF74_02620 [Psychromonas sp. Urea-02u-13]